MIYLAWFAVLCLICAVVDRCKAYGDLKAKYDTMVIEKNAELKRVRDRLAESIKETNSAIDHYNVYMQRCKKYESQLTRVLDIVEEQA